MSRLVCLRDGWREEDMKEDKGRGKLDDRGMEISINGENAKWDTTTYHLIM